MATPIWFSGSSPDAALAREDAWRRERTGVLEGDRFARAQAESMSMQAFLNNQAREDRLREVDMNRNQRSDELGYSRDVDFRNFLERQSNAEAFKPRIAAEAKLIEAQTKAVAENPMLKVGHSLAEKAANSGLILSPRDAVTNYGISLPEAKLYHNISKQVQGEIDKEDSELVAAASQLTRYMAAKNALKTLAPAPSGGMFWDSQATKDARVKHDADAAEQQRIIDQLQKRVDYLQNPKRQDILDRLDSDPATGAYIYSPPPRPWRMKGTTTSTGTTPAFFAPQPPVQAAPSAAGNMGGGYFPPAAPPAMTSGAPQTISTPQEYRALPSGARFLWAYPDGRIRPGRKP